MIKPSESRRAVRQDESDSSYRLIPAVQKTCQHSEMYVYVQRWLTQMLKRISFYVKDCCGQIFKRTFETKVGSDLSDCLC